MLTSSKNWAQGRDAVQLQLSMRAVEQVKALKFLMILQCVTLPPITMEVKNPANIAVTFQIRPVCTCMTMGERVMLHPCSVCPCRPGEVRLSLERLVLSAPQVKSAKGLAGGPPAMQLMAPKKHKTSYLIDSTNIIPAKNYRYAQLLVPLLNLWRRCAWFRAALTVLRLWVGVGL